jgi:hypothetical protein
MRMLFLPISHLLALAIGFAGGIYALPILIAPPPPAADELAAAASSARYRAELRRDLPGSDMLHWGEGTISIGADAIALNGRLAPGPDYVLYLSPQFVQTESEVLQHKASMVRVGAVRTFENFLVPLPDTVNPDDFSTVLIWCETFSQFISAGQYRTP